MSNEIINQTEESRFPQETNLTPRQWATYRLIKHNSLVEHRKTTQREIFEKVPGYEWNDNEKTHDHCPTVWADVSKNNLSFEHQHIIISKNFEYWIGSKRENKAYLRELWNKGISPRLKRYWNYVKLLGYDGQGRLFDKNLNPIKQGDLFDDSEIASQMFISSFNDYDIEMGKYVEDESDEEQNR